MSDVITCTVHGARPAAFVCGHSADAYSTRRQQPFHWTAANEDEPCGWCDECNERYLTAGEEWSGEAEARLDAQLVCADCFLEIIKFNGYN